MAINSRLAYSTESGRIRTDQPKPAETAPADGVVKVRREKKGRGGKTVTTVSGVPVGAKELKGLASELKRQCASGGSVNGGIIEIQGDHVDRVMELLADRGYEVKRSGG